MSAQSQTSRFALPDVLIVVYTFLGWAVGIRLLTAAHGELNVIGVLLTTHALVCSAYLIHECIHNTVSSSLRANDRLGMALSWLNGACLADYQRLKKKHLRHHADRLDVVTFDYRAALLRAPGWIRGGVLVLEWAYVPVIELMMRGLIIAFPFRYGTPADRVRVIALLSVRIAFFAALAVISIKAVLLYALAYFLFLHVLRFLDAFQHTYDVFPSPSLAPAPVDPKRTRRYEYENTYSNLLSDRLWWLNLLVLNFPYHNAHHERAGESWYRLPALHRELFGNKDPQVVTCRQLAWSYHRHRVSRILATDYGTVAAEGARASGFLGAVGVSFLTAV